jgi:hypothetical protein
MRNSRYSARRHKRWWHTRTKWIAERFTLSGERYVFLTSTDEARQFMRQMEHVEDLLCLAKTRSSEDD